MEERTEYHVGYKKDDTYLEVAVYKDMSKAQKMVDILQKTNEKVVVYEVTVKDISFYFTTEN